MTADNLKKDCERKARKVTSNKLCAVHVCDKDIPCDLFKDVLHALLCTYQEGYDKGTQDANKR